MPQSLINFPVELPLTPKPLTPPDNKPTHTDIFNLINSILVGLKYVRERIELVSKTDTAHTLVLTDAGADLEFNNASAVTVTIPLNTSVNFPVGTTLFVGQVGAGTVTIVGVTGVTVVGASGVATTAQYDCLKLTQIDENVWRVT